jgi:hypothetical protein
VPADEKLWASDHLARQITWLNQFTDALIEDVQKSLPEDCAPIEENARPRQAVTDAAVRQASIVR